MFVDQEDFQQDIFITVPTDFNYQENLNYLASAKGECLYYLKEHKIYRALQYGLTQTILEISYDDSHRLRLRLMGQATSQNLQLQEYAVRYVNEWFDLNRDLTAFYQLARTDNILSTPAQKFRGLRNMGIPDLFEAISWGIIGQQINLAFAYKLKKRFVETFGSAVAFDDTELWMFPTPQQIASLTIQDLTSLQFSARKAEYLIGVAKLIADGEITKEQLQSVGYKEAENMLTSIRGIGSWTANYVFMRCVRFPEAYPIADVGLHNALKYIMNTESKPSKEQIIDLFSRWNGWEAYATFYLWRLIY